MKIIQTTNADIIAKLNRSVHDLHVQWYPQYFKEYDYEAVKAFFQSFINKDNFIFLLLEDNEEAIGYAWIEIRKYPETPFRKAYKSIYVHQISIVETKRKKGYGSKLMEEIYLIASDNKIDLVELDYWTENEAAKDFYRKHGFSTYREFVYKRL
jgi:diamine N-acetyltransferase